jgi:hypothetical protein
MSNDTTSVSLHKNGHNGLNNNREEYRMDMKINDKVAEDDPLTGHQKWQVVENVTEISPPRWRHRLASTNFFMVIFLLAFVLQGAIERVFLAKTSLTLTFTSTFRLLFHILCFGPDNDGEALSYQVSVDRNASQFQ